MKKLSACIFLIVLFVGCISSDQVQVVKVEIEPPTDLEWKQGEKVKLTGTIWPSRAYTKFYIDTNDGKSAHLKSISIDKLEAGTKLFLTGTVEYVNAIGKAGASKIKHAQTYFYVNVNNYMILDENEEM